MDHYTRPHTSTLIDVWLDREAMTVSMSISMPTTSRVQLALNVDNLDDAIGFYSQLFGVEPAKVREGYANFAVVDPPLKLVLIENPGAGGTLNHLGVEVPTSDRVNDAIHRLSGEGLDCDVEAETTCCFAVQDKVWVTGPGGERWEVYTVLADAETWHGEEDSPETGCCDAEIEALPVRSLVEGPSSTCC